MAREEQPGVRRLVVILGDQLDPNSAALEGFDARHDAVWMAEVAEESTFVWSHKARIAVFLAAMRHYRDALRERGLRVLYRQLDEPGNSGSLQAELKAALGNGRPERIVLCEPGEWRVEQAIRKTARTMNVPLEIRPDRHFLCSADAFAEHAAGRKQLRMEYFYRQMRRKAGVLMDAGRPEGGKWNYDSENRGSFDANGPKGIPKAVGFPPDETTREVLRLVETSFSSHPGQLDRFDWPVTPDDATSAPTPPAAIAITSRDENAGWRCRSTNGGRSCASWYAWAFHTSFSPAASPRCSTDSPR